jgi:hypothetical protein
MPTVVKHVNANHEAVPRVRRSAPSVRVRMDPIWTPMVAKRARVYLTRRTHRGMSDGHVSDNDTRCFALRPAHRLF